jgi:hypothetical protein
LSRKKCWWAPQLSFNALRLDFPELLGTASGRHRIPVKTRKRNGYPVIITNAKTSWENEKIDQNHQCLQAWGEVERVRRENGASVESSMFAGVKRISQGWEKNAEKRWKTARRQDGKTSRKKRQPQSQSMNTGIKRISSALTAGKKRKLARQMLIL